MKKIKLSILFIFLLITVCGYSQEIKKEYIPYKTNKGETIKSISKKFSITPHDLLKLNPDIKDSISVNQVIIIPNKDFKTINDIEKGDYVKDGFLYHKVLPKENFFRLKQQYDVSKRMLRKYNLELRTDGLKEGQVIKIPVKKGFELESAINEVVDTKPYLVKSKETKYSIARRYGITVEMLEELNPHLKENGLKLAEIIKVPNTREIPDIDADYVIHQVEKGETIFSLGQKFKISQEELIVSNPKLKEGLKEGMLVKIPKSSFNESTQLFIPNIPENRQLNMVMMLPFTSKGKTELDFENDKALEIVTDFYSGSLIALDSLKKQGLSVNVKVFDTKNDKLTIGTILRSVDFDNVDLVVGPMYLNNVQMVSQALANKDLAIISPASSKNHSLFATNNLIKEIPSDETLSEKTINYINDNYSGQNIIAVIDDVKENQAKFNKIVAQLNKLDSIKAVTVLKPEKGYIKPDIFKKKIVEENENLILLLTDDEVVTADVINNLGVLPDKIKLTLYTLDYGKNFEKIDNNFLARVHFHYPVSSFIDRDNDTIKKFIDKYKLKNYVTPSEYAFKGFDIVYDALLRLATYPEFNNAFKGGISERLSSKFYYTKHNNKFFENIGSYLIKYEGLNLVKVE